MSEPVRTLVIYRPGEGREDDLRALVQRHGPVLRDTGLITDRPVQAWEATDKRSGSTFFVEIFEWKDSEASDVAHQTPEIMAVWEPMEQVLDDLTIAQLTPLSAAGG